MDDTAMCPICGEKFRNLHFPNKHLPQFNKTANFTERTCAGLNHVIVVYADNDTKKIDYIKLSLNPKYSKYLEINFVQNKCRIHCMKEGESQYIDIPKMIEPDFPTLEKLKEKVSLYVVFS